jgi:hypothetical protein
MPDASVVCCASCNFYTTVVQLVPHAEDYYTCARPGCGRRQPALVVVRNGVPLRSYNVHIMKQQARELNAIAERRHSSGSISRQKVRLLEQMSRQALSRLDEQGQLSMSSAQTKQPPQQPQESASQKPMAAAAAVAASSKGATEAPSVAAAPAP